MPFFPRSLCQVVFDLETPEEPTSSKALGGDPLSSKGLLSTPTFSPAVTTVGDDGWCDVDDDEVMLESV